MKKDSCPVPAGPAGRGELLLAIVVLLALGTAAGLFLAGRTLAPIDRITRTAQTSGAGNLQGRLGLAPRADEVGRSSFLHG